MIAVFAAPILRASAASPGTDPPSSRAENQSLKSRPAAQRNALGRPAPRRRRACRCRYTDAARTPPDVRADAVRCARRAP
ncbi:hypothetical protein LP419_25365 [Massilia sp. H-1]|nr:hypothetical protein LP419_25365 [Massilia sp. H-1]